MIKSDGFYDYAWNPVTGCCHGCPYCYGERDFKRWGLSYEPTFHPERLNEPLAIKEPQRIFVTHYTDIVGNFIPEQWVKQVLAVIKDSIHEYIFITKNPEGYYKYEFPDNCILGVTIEKPELWHRAEVIRDMKNRKLASIEPLLGDFTGYDFAMFDEVVIGGMINGKSGINTKWVNSIKHSNIFYKPNARKYLK